MFARYARIRLGTNAVNIILSKVRLKYYELMHSPVIKYEIESIPDDFERIEIINLLDKYASTPEFNPRKIKTRVEELIDKKLDIADAAHVAFSEYYDSVCISCDDKLLKKCERIEVKNQCMNPVIFCELEKLR